MDTRFRGYDGIREEDGVRGYDCIREEDKVCGYDCIGKKLVSY